jgi:ketosteroid isomerase-like protein
MNEAEAVVRDLYDAFARGDVPTVMGLMADDIDWRECEGLPWGGTQSGPTAVAQNVFGPAIELVSDFKVTPVEIMSSGDLVAVLHHYTGTGSATGEKLDVFGSGWWDVKDGKIIRYRQFVDTWKFCQAVPRGDTVG